MCEWPSFWYAFEFTMVLTLFIWTNISTARCNLTFLSIQEPGISKFCSQCETEYLDEDSIDSSYGSDLVRTFQTLSDAFDVCIYCGGKFRS